MKYAFSIVLALILFFGTNVLEAQPDRWQQRAEYTMEIDFDVRKHQFAGKQKLVYFNNSPEELHKVFYHLYFNAFQPGSMMDVRNQNLQDADRRVKSRIGRLSEEEIGYQKIKSLKMDGTDVEFEVVGTILEVNLPKAIAPKSQVTFEMEFEAQVPLQIRRSGRDNAEGIDYSMTQWYPKMCEYDYQGWHSNPYVGREFHGIWGDFDVKITIDKNYVIGGTGYLQNPDEIGHGYQKQGTKVKYKKKQKKLTWHFVAPNVHDFAWGADPDYEHVSYQAEAGLTMHFFYQ
ncbi:MAG: M1 family peptidase, partial [Bacteroidota bacterium]